MTDTNETTQLARYDNRQVSVFSTGENFEQAQRVAKMLAQSDLVPDAYRGNIANCMIALEISQRTGTGAFEVTQNLEVISGRPSWKSSYVIAKLNSCGRFAPLEFETEDRGTKTVAYTETEWTGPRGGRSKNVVEKKIEVHDVACRVVTENLRSGREILGPWISIEMAVKEGWYTRNGSKWQTMPDIMLNYRAASFFGRMNAPEVLLGMHSAEEVIDIGEIDYVEADAEPVTQRARSSKVDEINSKVDEEAEKETAAAEPEEKKPAPKKETKKAPYPEPDESEEEEDWDDDDDPVL